MSDKKLGFAENFMLSGVAAGVSKTAGMCQQYCCITAVNIIIFCFQLPPLRESSCLFKIRTR